MNDPKVIKDFKLINLTGVLYKIIAKTFTSRLVLVIGSIIALEQSTFIKGKQILDGPMLMNKVIYWCKKIKKKTMIIKVDFEKACDTIS